MNTATIATPIINQTNQTNQINQKMNNQSNSQTLEGDLFALLFQNLLGSSQKGIELADNLTANSNSKEELFAYMQQSIMNKLEELPLEEQTVGQTIDQSLGLLEEYQDQSTNSSLTIDSLLVSLQTILYNSTNLVEDVRSWYQSLPNEQRSSFDLLFTQWQLQENQSPTVKNELADLLKHYIKDSSLVEKFQQIIQKELGRSAQSNLINEHQEQGLSNTHSFEKNLIKEKQFPVMLERIDLSSYKGESNLAIQGKLEQGSTNMNSKVENETSNVDIRQLQTSYTHALLATKDTANNVSGSATNTVYYEMNSKDISSELGKLIMKNIKLPNGVTEMKIQLHPHELGKIDIKLTSQQGNLTAMFLADTAVGKEMLENSLQILRHSLVQQGIQVDRIEVISSATSNALNGDHLEQNTPFHQQNHSSQHQKGKSAYHEDEQSFLPDDSIGEHMEIEEMNLILETRGINYTV